MKNRYEFLIIPVFQLVSRNTLLTISFFSLYGSHALVWTYYLFVDLFSMQHTSFNFIFHNSLPTSFIEVYYDQNIVAHVYMNLSLFSPRFIMDHALDNKCLSSVIQLEKPSFKICFFYACPSPLLHLITSSLTVQSWYYIILYLSLYRNCAFFIFLSTLTSHTEHVKLFNT